MIGRQRERALAITRLRLATENRGQVIAISAEAGIGSPVTWPHTTVNRSPTMAPAYAYSLMLAGTSVPATISSRGSWPSDTSTGARPSLANQSLYWARPCLPACASIVAERPSSWTMTRYAPRLTRPVEGSLVITAQPVPM